MTLNLHSQNKYHTTWGKKKIPLPGKASLTPTPPTKLVTAIHLCVFVHVLSPSLESTLHEGDFPVSQIKTLKVTLAFFLSITSHIQLSEILLTLPQKIFRICPLLTTFITTKVFQATGSVPWWLPPYFHSWLLQTFLHQEARGILWKQKIEMPLLHFPTLTEWKKCAWPTSPSGNWPANSQFSSLTLPLLSLLSHQPPVSTMPALSWHLTTSLELPTTCSHSPYRYSQCSPSFHSAFYPSSVFRHHPHSPFILLCLQSSYHYMTYFIIGC